MNPKQLEKAKDFLILDILRTHSDEDHCLSIKQILEYLKEFGVHSCRQTMYNDINFLRSMGYDIECKRKTQNQYYFKQNNFTLPELKILIDAVSCSNFITESKSKELVNKLTTLAGVFKGEILLHNTMYSNEYKRTNENIFSTINAIEKAIQKGKQIGFKYFDTNIYGERVYRRDGEIYHLNPVRLTISDNKYYLICYSNKHPSLSVYRLDRMDKVVVQPTDKKFAACEKPENVDKFLNGLFDMFSGKKREKVDLLCKNTLAITEIINDKFGSEKIIVKKDEDSFVVRANIGIGPTFYAWLTTFNGDIQIAFPKNIKEEYTNFLKNNLENL